MKLDYDCVRDILLSLEELIQYGENMETTPVSFETLLKHDLIKNYSKQSVIYCSEKLEEASFINARIIYADGGILGAYYSSITFEGHQYLDSIRSNALWNKVKASFIEKGISLTFDLIMSCAPQIAIKMLNL